MKIEKLYDRELADILSYEEFVEKIGNKNLDEIFLRELHKKY